MAGGSRHCGNEANKPFVRLVSKGVYGRYRSVLSNFATLNPVTEVMQRNAYVWCNIQTGVLYIFMVRAREYIRLAWADDVAYP